MLDNLTAAFKRLGNVSGECVVTTEEFTKTMEQALKSEFTVGQRIQFYRKGWAEKGEKEPTLAINGIIKRIDPKTGWLHVEHKWGWAVVKPDDEKLQVLQQKKSKNDPAETDAIVVEGGTIVQGHHRAKNEEYAKVYGATPETLATQFNTKGAETGRV